MNQSDFIAQLVTKRHAVARSISTRSTQGRAPIPGDVRRMLVLGLLMKQAALLTRTERQQLVDSLPNANV